MPLTSNIISNNTKTSNDIINKCIHIINDDVLSKKNIKPLLIPIIETIQSEIYPYLFIYILFIFIIFILILANFIILLRTKIVILKND